MTRNAAGSSQQLLTGYLPLRTQLTCSRPVRATGASQRPLPAVARLGRRAGPAGASLRQQPTAARLGQGVESLRVRIRLGIELSV